MKTAICVAAVAAMILGQEGACAAESTPAILKSVKTRQTLDQGQMKNIKGEYYPFTYRYPASYYINNTLATKAFYPYLFYPSFYNTPFQYSPARYVGPFGWYFH